MKIYLISCWMLRSSCIVSRNALPVMLPCIPENLELSLATVEIFCLYLERVIILSFSTNKPRRPFNLEDSFCPIFNLQVFQLFPSLQILKYDYFICFCGHFPQLSLYLVDGLPSPQHQFMLFQHNLNHGPDFIYGFGDIHPNVLLGFC
jgi:hypothetical protein